MKVTYLCSSCVTKGAFLKRCLVLKKEHMKNSLICGMVFCNVFVKKVKNVVDFKFSFIYGVLFISRFPIIFRLSATFNAVTMFPVISAPGAYLISKH